MVRISKIDGVTVIQPTLEEHDRADGRIKERMAWGRKNLHLAGRVATLTPYVRGLCKRLSESDPVSIQVKPYDGARPQRCYINVATYCQVKGGRMATGWKIWELADHYEFEHHAAWAADDGRLTCLTPQLLSEESVLFLPDRVMTAEEAEGRLAGSRPAHFFPKDPEDRLARELCDALKRASDAAVAGEGTAELYWRREVCGVFQRLRRRRTAPHRPTPKQRATRRRRNKRNKDLTARQGRRRRAGRGG